MGSLENEEDLVQGLVLSMWKTQKALEKSSPLYELLVLVVQNRHVQLSIVYPHSDHLHTLETKKKKEEKKEVNTFHQKQ